MVKKVLSILLIFFAVIILMQTAEAADTSFAERSAGMAEIKDLRYSIGSGRLRIVIDLTKKARYELKFAENPSRMVIDISNAWLSDKVPKSAELSSTAASKLRIAQFDSKTVRLVIETSAENNTFMLDGGPAGYRLVVDIGADAEKPGFDKKISGPMEPINTEEPNKKDINKTPESAPDSDKNDKDAKNKTDKTDKKDKSSKKDKSDKKNKSDKKDKNDKKDKDYVDKPFDDVDDKLKNLTGLNGKIIVIDPGHGGNDSGAIGPSGVMEKTVTLKVGLELEKMLEDKGATVIMTRSTDIEVAPRGRHATDIEELKSRCDIANAAKADIFISIHADSFTNPAARGSTGYYFSQGSDQSKKLADCIRKALCAELQTPSRGTQPCNFYVVRNTDMPATLIELAFISNPIEEKLLNSNEGVQKAAQGIFDGIEDYFG